MLGKGVEEKKRNGMERHERDDDKTTRERDDDLKVENLRQRVSAMLDYQVR